MYLKVQTWSLVKSHSSRLIVVLYSLKLFKDLYSRRNQLKSIQAIKTSNKRLNGTKTSHLKMLIWNSLVGFNTFYYLQSTLLLQMLWHLNKARRASITVFINVCMWRHSGLEPPDTMISEEIEGRALFTVTAFSFLTPIKSLFWM